MVYHLGSSIKNIYITQGIYNMVHINLSFAAVVVVQLSHYVRLFATPWTAAAKPPCPSPFPRVCLSSCSPYWWCHPTISSSDVLFSFCPQSFPASGTFPMSRLFSSDGQNTGAAALELVLSVNIQGWSPLRLTSLISLLSKGLSGLFSSTTVWKHQFFSVMPLQSNFYNCTWPLGRL